MTFKIYPNIEYTPRILTLITNNNFKKGLIWALHTTKLSDKNSIQET